MNEYKVAIYERYRKTLTVEAESPDDAIIAAKALWENGDILLGDRDFFDSQVEVIEEGKQ